MAIYSPRLWWAAIALLLVAPHTHCQEFTFLGLWQVDNDQPWLGPTNCKEAEACAAAFTKFHDRHENIKEAMISIVRMIRTTESKLERHEMREKGLGEQIKKMLNNLDKKHKDLEPLVKKISRLDDRLSQIETSILLKDEREKSSQSQVNAALSGIQSTLETLVPVSKALSDLNKNSSTMNIELQRQLNATNAKIDAVTEEIKNLKSSLNPDSLRAMCLEVASNSNPFEKHISEAEKLLNRYELKLNEYNGTVNHVPTDFVPLNEVAVADQAWQCNVSEVMERQVQELKKVQDVLVNSKSSLNEVPKSEDFKHLTTRLENINDDIQKIISNQDDGVSKVVSKIRDLGNRLVTTNEDIQKSLTDSNTVTEHVYNDMSKSYQDLRTEVLLLTRDNQKIQNMSDNVLYTKKWLEYGVNQIPTLIRGQHKQTNEFVGMKLDDVGATIMNNQSRGLTNLTTAIDADLAQVWRHIGNMHNQIMQSRSALNELSLNTKEFANNTMASMIQLKKEMGDVTKQMFKLGDDVNYVVGGLSVASHEFKLMASGLHESIQKLNANTTEAPTTTIDPGPGPHPIQTK